MAYPLAGSTLTAAGGLNVVLPLDLGIAPVAKTASRNSSFHSNFGWPVRVISGGINVITPIAYAVTPIAKTATKIWTGINLNPPPVPPPSTGQLWPRGAGQA
jgi:hypothetical protein